MADRITPLHEVKEQASDALDRLRTDVDQMIDGLDFRDLARQVEDFGRRSPVALAFAALTVGVAAGVLMRRNLET
jgi:hypothetical protein